MAPPTAARAPRLASIDDGAPDAPEEMAIEGDFTVRAVVVGLAVGVVLCMTNIYFGLQTGWVSMMSLQSALLGYAIFQLIPLAFPSSRPLTPQENVVLQTTAVATGTMPLAAGLVGIVPALAQLSPAADGHAPIELSYASLVLWCLAVAFFGVFLAAPLRKQVIVKEKLVFPSGTATAQLIALLHRAGTQDAPERPAGYRRLRRDSASSDRAPRAPEEKEDEMGGRAWWALAWSFAASGAMTVLSFLFPIIFAIPVFDVFSAPFGTSLAADWMWWFTPSLSYVGQGIIMGFPVTLSMNAGMLVGWAVLGPVAKHAGWAPGKVASTTDGARGWILWVALAIMIAESVISLLPITITYAARLVRHARQRRAGPRVFAAPSRAADEDDDDLSAGAARPASHFDASDDYFDPLPGEDDDASDDGGEGGRGAPEVEPPERLVPTFWVVWGLAASAALGVVLVWVVFGSDGIKPWATAIGLVLASVLSLIGVRALGETDINPDADAQVSGIGKISQLLFAVLQPGNVVANIIAGGVAEAGAQQAGDLMQDLKTGQLLRASPRSQFYGQMIGSLASVFVSAAGYKFYTSVYQIPGPQFAVPSAGVWLNLARLLNNGSLPAHVVPFMLAFGAVFASLALFKAFAPRHPALRPYHARYARLVPSGIAFAIGFLNSPSFSLARLIGGYIAHRTASTSRTGAVPLFAIVVASGLVLGEGVLSVATLALTSAGYGAVSCAGCGVGGGGYCSGGC